jgi:hypothetical protein
MINPSLNEPLYRQAVDNLTGAAESCPEKAYQIVDYMDGNDIFWIKSQMAERYAMRIEKVQNPKGETEVIQIKDQKAISQAMKSKMFEVNSLGVLNKIISETADLSRNTSFKYINTANGEEATAVAESIAFLRDEAAFSLSLARTDELSVGVGSSAMWIQVIGNQMVYNPVSRDNIFIAFSDRVLQNNEYRPSKKFNIQEAAVVVIRLENSKYVAYFGRSEEYPQGRMVTYKSSSWDGIPDVGGDTYDEYVDEDGNIANPLTLNQDDQDDYTLPEYPVVIWRGDSKGYGKKLMPVNSSTYDQCLDLDVASSRIQTAANKSARGSWQILRDTASASDQIPANIDEGFAVLGVGQSVNVLNISGADIQAAMEVFEKQAMYKLDAAGVPSYKMTVSQNVAIPSGVALVELNKPSAITRQTRAEINRAAMRMIFDIEKSLISLELGENYAEGVEQQWFVHPDSITKSTKETYEEAMLAEEAGLKDRVQNVVDTIDGIENRKEAEEYLAQLTPVVKEQPAPSGLAGFAQRAAQTQNANR